MCDTRFSVSDFLSKRKRSRELSVSVTRATVLGWGPRRLPTLAATTTKACLHGVVTRGSLDQMAASLVTNRHHVRARKAGTPASYPFSAWILERSIDPWLAACSCKAYAVDVRAPDPAGFVHVCVGCQLPRGQLDRPIGGNPSMPFSAFWYATAACHVTCDSTALLVLKASLGMQFGFFFC